MCDVGFSTATEKAEIARPKESEGELQLRVKALQKQVSMQEAEKQQQQQMIGRLQREKLVLQGEAAAGQSRATAAARSQLEKKMKNVKAVVNSGLRGMPVSEPAAKPSRLPTYTAKVPRDKEYEPGNFAKEHVDDIVRENQELKMRVRSDVMPMKQSK